MKYIKTSIRKTIRLTGAATMALVLTTACSSDVSIPSLPQPESTPVVQGVTLQANQLFGIWEGETEVGNNNTNHFGQQYRIEFQSVDDAEAIFSHWFIDATSTIRDSVCGVEYSYTFDGSTAILQPKPSAQALGATRIKAVHTGGNKMVIYAEKENVTTTMCTLSRTSDPVPTITGVNRTLPQAGERIILSGRNLQFVDHLYLPTTNGEQEITDFQASSRQISFTMPQADVAAGHIRCQATGSHVDVFSPAMFCRECVFFSNFSTEGKKAPYTGTEFENTINITQSLLDKIMVTTTSSLPEGHCLYGKTGIISPDTMLCFFADTLTAWPVDNGLDPSTGSLRFSFGDRINYVIDHSGGIITEKSKCSEVAIEMDIYVESEGQAEWNTGFVSFRLDKDQGKSLTQSWFAQTAMWSMDQPVSFADGWQTYTIPLSSFRVTESEAYSTLGNLMRYLKKNNKQSILKLINYQLDDQHPAQSLGSFQFCVANIRLVPYKSYIPSL
ncbi:MAG: hypothetical protein IJ647_01075 [Prevotella sp.]|nr:hypothetical protein [Prevotella sp.]